MHETRKKRKKRENNEPWRLSKTKKMTGTLETRPKKMESNLAGKAKKRN
jgi:hypothetical protein